MERFEIHVIRRCVVCNQDVAATNQAGWCPGCAKLERWDQMIARQDGVE